MKTTNKLVVASIFLSLMFVLAYSAIAPATVQASSSILTTSELQSVVIWEKTTSTGQAATAHVFNLTDPALINQISLSATSAYDFTTGAHENYDIYVSAADGTLNPNGNYITVDCYTDSDTATNLSAGNNIDSVELKFANNSIYASSVASFQLGAGLSGVYLTNDGYSVNALGAPDDLTPDMGNHFSRITLGFTIPTVSVSCTTNSQCGTNGLTGNLFCQGNNIYQNYITWTCNNPGTASSSCSSSTTAQLQTTCSGNQTCSGGSCISNGGGGGGGCSSNFQERCSGSNLYWYDSCGNQQNLIQYCPNGCSGNSCQNYYNYYNYNTCAYHSYERCSGNNLYWYDSCGSQQDLAQYCSNGCYNNSCQNYVPTYNLGSLTVTKTVKDLTTGSGFLSSVYASPSDMLMFLITIKNNSGIDVQNVLVKDTLPANLIYNNQLVIACSGATNGYNNCSNNYNYSGSITPGINLTAVYSGQTATISYQAQVAAAQNFSFGTTTLTNNVSITGANSFYAPAANASVIVTKAAVLGASTVSTGLTNNFWLDSFFLPLIITLIGIWMLKSGMFFGIEKWLDNKKKIRRTHLASKELTRRIATIKKSGKI